MMKTATLPFNQSITENGIPKTVSHLSISDKTGLTLVDVPIGANPMIGGRFHRVHSGCINKVLSVGPTQNFRGYMSDSMRLDKWLWAARFFKTRSLASQEITKGRVQVNQQMVKPARDIKPGDTLWIKRRDTPVTVVVKALSHVRGPAPVAQQLYTETPESIAAREKADEMRRLAPEPARQLAHGRPTKRDRRLIDQIRSFNS